MDSKKAKTAVKPVAETKSSSGTFDIAEINELLKAFTKSNVNELKIEKGDFKITIKQGATVVAAPMVQSAPMQVSTPVQAAPVAAAPAATPSVPSPAPAPTSDNLITIKSPMIGTFYRSAGPGKPSFVNVGDEIQPGKILCIVEAMKLFNEIESEHSGKIVKVLVDDASPVEYDQPLFLVEP